MIFVLKLDFFFAFSKEERISTTPLLIPENSDKSYRFCFARIFAKDVFPVSVGLQRISDARHLLAGFRDNAPLSDIKLCRPTKSACVLGLTIS